LNVFRGKKSTQNDMLTNNVRHLLPSNSQKMKCKEIVLNVFHDEKFTKNDMLTNSVRHLLS